MTGSTNSSKKENGKAEGATTVGESTGENNPITSGIEPPSDVIVDDVRAVKDSRMNKFLFFIQVKYHIHTEVQLCRVKM